MTDIKVLAQAFADALARGDRAALEGLLHEDARLRWWGWHGTEAHRPRGRVLERLAGEWTAWTDSRQETCTLTADGERAVVEYRVQGTDPHSGRFVEHNRALVLTALDGQAHTLDLYCAEPLPSAPRRPPPAPATLSTAELEKLFELSRQGFDLREAIDANNSDVISLRGGRSDGDDTHPAGNYVGGARWSAGEADARITANIEHFAARGAGFQWWVTPYDTPADLPERLERHGLVRAGGYVKMARVGLDDLSDIPLNPRVEAVPVDGTDEDLFQAAMHVITVSFHAPPQQAAQFATHWRERLADPQFRQDNVIYLARLDGQPAGTGRIVLRGPMGYLVAGSTLPEFRGQRVYATLLRRRLEAARARGFHIVSLDAGPMSRAVVERYRFEPFGTTHVFAWMPEIDLDVIRSLVPAE